MPRLFNKQYLSIKTLIAFLVLLLLTFGLYSIKQSTKFNQNKVTKIEAKISSDFHKTIIINDQNQIDHIISKLNKIDKRLKSIYNTNKGWEITIDIYQPHIKRVVITNNIIQFGSTTYTVKDEAQLEEIKSYFYEQLKK